MKYKKWLLKYLSPFLLVSYTCLGRAVAMIVSGDTGFGLVFIQLLLVLALFFLMADFFLKRIFKESTRTVLLLEATISLILVLGSLYLEFRKSKHEPGIINVKPV